MKIVYLIPVYKNFDQFLRLVDRLNVPDTHFLIHIDKKVSDECVSYIRTALLSMSNITYMERKDILWGAIDLVQLYCDAFTLLIEEKYEFDFLVYASGQDYPIKSNDQIFATLDQNRDKQFLEYFPIPRAGWGIDDGRDRYERYHFFTRKGYFCYPPVAFTSPKYKWARFLLPHKRRTIPGNMTPYGGSALFTMSKTGVEFFYNYLRTPLGKQVMAFFKRTNIPDEMMLQTILMNSPLKDTVVNTDLRYIDWKDRGPHPTIFTVDYFDVLSQADALFARKFDMNVDSEILNRIDRELLNRR